MFTVSERAKLSPGSVHLAEEVGLVCLVVPAQSQTNEMSETNKKNKINQTNETSQPDEDHTL